MDNIDKNKLVAYYNLVEVEVISILGGYDKAADYFDQHNCLNSLWQITAECYLLGSKPEAVARQWHKENAACKITKVELLPTRTPAVATHDPVIHYPSTYKYTYAYKSKASAVEPEILIARAARRKLWRGANVSL